MSATTFKTTPLPRKRARPNLEPIFTRLRFPLAALHPLPDGPPHPAFPKTLLAYHLLSEETLNNLAHYYHQIPNPNSPTIWLYSYPSYMNWDGAFFEHLKEVKGAEVMINVKRRKFGKFIGLRGCETPVEELEEKARWLRKREELTLKSDDAAFWGRRGWGRW